MSSLRFDVGYVGGGTLQGLLGTGGAAYAQFTFNNGTTRYVGNGTYSASKPATWAPTSVWTSTSATSFTFTMPTAYILTDPIITAFGALPMHIYEKVKASTWATSFLSGFTGSSGGLSKQQGDSYLRQGPLRRQWQLRLRLWPIGDGPYLYRGYDPSARPPR